MSDLTPGSAEWLRIVTASKVAAILGLSPWESPRSLWLRMHGDLPADEGNNDTRRGMYLEPAILAWWRDQKPGILTDWQEQPTFRLARVNDSGVSLGAEPDGVWAAATPDASCSITDGGEDISVLVEAKSTAQEWDDLPAYYLTQVIWQMHVSGIHRCHVPVIGPRLTFTEYVVDYAEYADDAAMIERRCREFYDSLATDAPPPLDDSVATYEAVRKVHPDIERGEAVELDRKQAKALIEWTDELKATEKATRLAKSTVIDLMGRAQYATHNGVRIARRQASKHGVTFVVTASPSDLTGDSA